MKTYLTPVPEQEEGADWLIQDFQRLLGDVQGYGKTGQALLAAKKVNAQRIVVCCPAIARLNWEREAKLWGLELPVLRVTEKAEHKLPHPDAPQLVIASYDGIARSKVLRGRLNRGLHDVLILDEAHRLKERIANRTKAIYGCNIDGHRALASKAMYRWLLTASPLMNHPGELWTHLATFWPDLIREPVSGKVLDQDGFLSKYCRLQWNQYGYKVIGYKDKDGLIEILQKIMLRRTEIKGLPDLVLRDEPTLLEITDSEETKRLKELESHPELSDIKVVLEDIMYAGGDADEKESDFIHFSTLRRYTGLLKAKPAAQLIVEETDVNDKVVVFATHREVVDKLTGYFMAMGMNPAEVHGGVNDAKRNSEIDRFNSDGACRIFVGQIQTCSEIINLPAANRVRLVEPSLCPETNMQAIKRVHRRGQTRQVFAGAIALADSVDELVTKLLMQKTRNIEQLMKRDYHA